MKSCAATHSAQSTARNSKSALQANINGASPSEGQAQAKPRKHKRSTVVRKGESTFLMTLIVFSDEIVLGMRSSHLHMHARQFVCSPVSCVCLLTVCWRWRSSHASRYAAKPYGPGTCPGLGES